jgi:hypothetical protein
LARRGSGANGSAEQMNDRSEGEAQRV